MFKSVKWSACFASLLLPCLAGCRDDSVNQSAPPTAVQKPPASAIDANELLAVTLAEAKELNKNVMIVFDTNSCGWCVLLMKFLDQNETMFQKDYVILEINQSTMRNGTELREKYTADHSVPWSAIVNSQGTVLTTSSSDKGNIGCPITVEERKHFLTMIKASTISMTEEDINAVAKALDDFAEPVRQMQERGDRESIAELIKSAEG
jgi:hypothetical protein